MLALYIFLFVVGLVLLVKGADWFVDGSSCSAKKMGVSPLVVGLTIVAFGTSAPELAVSITSAIRGSTDLAIGNVVGSNIANVLLILGVTALIKNLPVQKNSVRLDLPVMLTASVLLILLGLWNGGIDWWDGLIFLLLFSAYLVLLFRNAKRDKPTGELEAELPTGEEEPKEGKKKSALAEKFEALKEKPWFLVVLTLVGLAMVVGGGILLVESAKKIAEFFKVSERIIALTIVAVGTSLPELVTSVVAAIKGETDIAVGNVIGSNIFNILLVAGTSSLFCPLKMTTANFIDAGVAIGAAVLLFVFCLFKKRQLGKVAGAVFLSCFVGYYVYLFLA